MILWGETGSSVPKGPFPVTTKVFHRPDDVIFDSRPYDMDLFVDHTEDTIENVSIFFKTNEMSHFSEHHLTKTRARYRFRFNPTITPAASITYFFVVTLRDGSVYAAPLNKHGNINVIERILVDPAEYFKQRLASRR